MTRLTALLTVLFIATIAVLAACGDDDESDTPTQRPTPTPAVEPSAQGDDDEAQIRYAVESFVYNNNANDFDAMCGLYAQSVLSAFSCEEIQSSLLGYVAASGGERVKARTPGIDEVSVDGDTGSALYTLCLDIGAGETCTEYTINLVREEGAWKISG